MICGGEISIHTVVRENKYKFIVVTISRSVQYDWLFEFSQILCQTELMSKTHCT